MKYHNTFKLSNKSLICAITSIYIILFSLRHITVKNAVAAFTFTLTQTVLQEIAKDIDPEGEGKTLIYVVNDAHADLIVKLLKQIYEPMGVDNDARVKNQVDMIIAKLQRQKRRMTDVQKRQLPARWKTTRDSGRTGCWIRCIP